MTLHLCQGPKCHTYETQSRVRGMKGSKVLRTRKARFNMNVDRDWIRNWEHYFCDERCMNDWLDVHMVQLINYVGIKNIPSETPIDIVKTTHKNWAGNEYVRTTIKLLSDQSDDDTVTA